MHKIKYTPNFTKNVKKSIVNHWPSQVDLNYLKMRHLSVVRINPPLGEGKNSQLKEN